ncbi:MAG: hypothetical protein MdMp014T_1003 [Treponematales bacterium]
MLLHIFLTAVFTALIGVVIYFALSPQSSRAARLAAFIILCAVILGIAAALVIILSEPAAEAGKVISALPAGETAPPKKPVSAAVITAMTLLALLMLGIALMVIREERRRGKAE